jgi:hypothetical protein
MFLEGTRHLPGPPGEGSAAAPGRAMRSLSLASEARLAAHVVWKDRRRSLGRAAQRSQVTAPPAPPSRSWWGLQGERVRPLGRNLSFSKFS